MRLREARSVMRVNVEAGQVRERHLPDTTRRGRRALKGKTEPQERRDRASEERSVKERELDNPDSIPAMLEGLLAGEAVSHFIDFALQVSRTSRRSIVDADAGFRTRNG